MNLPAEKIRPDSLCIA